MKALKLNLDLSKQVFNDMESMREEVGLKECYRNTFKAISTMNFLNGYDIEDYSVAYGFLDRKIGDSRMYFRHAFIIDKRDNSVIDVTACLWEEVIEEKYDFDYYVFKEYSNMESYTDALISAYGDPALNNATKENEVCMVNKLSELGLELNPIDLMDLLSNVCGRNMMEYFEEYQESKKIIIK